MSGNINRINTLTSLRFFAAIMIIIGHSRGVFFNENIFNHFAFFQGVSFFFVLSGFILTIVYPTLSKQHVGQFYLARFARIWPAHIAALMLFLLLFHNKITINLSQFMILLTNVNLIHGWIPDVDYYFSFNAPSWSISTEAFFYFCFPLLIYRWRHTWFFKLILSFGLVVLLIIYCNLANLKETTTVPGIHGLIYINPLSRIFEFILGMVFASAFKKFNNDKLSFVIMSFLELSALLLIFINLLYSANLATNTIIPLNLAEQYWVIYCSTCIWFAFLILFVSMQNGIVSRVLNFPIIVLLGEMSYSLYLVHYLFMFYCYTHGAWWLRHHPVETYIFYWFVILCWAYLMWRLIECSARKWIKNSVYSSPSFKKLSLMNLAD